MLLMVTGALLFIAMTLMIIGLFNLDIVVSREGMTLRIPSRYTMIIVPWFGATHVCHYGHVCTLWQYIAELLWAFRRRFYYDREKRILFIHWGLHNFAWYVTRFRVKYMHLYDLEGIPLTTLLRRKWNKFRDHYWVWKMDDGTVMLGNRFRIKGPWIQKDQKFEVVMYRDLTPVRRIIG